MRLLFSTTVDVDGFFTLVSTLSDDLFVVEIDVGFVVDVNAVVVEIDGFGCCCCCLLEGSLLLLCCETIGVVGFFMLILGDAFGVD